MWKFAICALLIGVAIGVILSRVEPSRAYLFGERVLAHAGLAKEAAGRSGRRDLERALEHGLDGWPWQAQWVRRALR